MRTWIILGLLGAGAYYLHQNGYLNLPKDGAFDDQGRPMARVFVAPNCGQRCDDVTSMLNARSIQFDLVDLSTPEASRYGVRQYPLTMIGELRVLGNDREGLVSALAENFGPDALTPLERAAMKGHFEEDGKPAVVLYGAEWCGYCKKQREYFAAQGIPYYYIDVEASPAGKMAYDALRGGGYPLVYVGYRRFPGYNEDPIKRALDELS